MLGQMPTSNFGGNLPQLDQFKGIGKLLESQSVTPPDLGKGPSQANIGALLQSVLTSQAQF